jgi:hypothetical protein
MIVNKELTPIKFEKYTNPFTYQNLENGCYVVAFKNDTQENSKIVCFSPKGIVISDSYYSYIVENGKIKGVSTVYDMYGNEVDYKEEFFEISK